jgi:hypothetical protein
MENMKRGSSQGYLYCSLAFLLTMFNIGSCLPLTRGPQSIILLPELWLHAMNGDLLFPVISHLPIMETNNKAYISTI